MKKTDTALRFYHEVFGLDRLHYGLWDGEPLSFDGLRSAQERYESRLAGIIAGISGDSRGARVLDAGCGSGEMVKTLSVAGFDAEGLSPDAYQEKIFRTKTGAKFHLCRFEDFSPAEKYRVVLMSESAQYMNLEGLFLKAGECLGEGGRLVVSDYFVKEGASGPQAVSGHGLGEFVRKAAESGFTEEMREDITDMTAPTLDFAMALARGYVMPALTILRDKYRARHPVACRLAGMLLGGKIREIKRKTALIDSGEFRKNKRYMVFVLGKHA